MAEDVRARLAELDGLLKAGLRDRPVVTFASLRRTGAYPVFDAGPLAEPLPPPLWEHFAPEEPSGLGKFFGGAGRFEQAARQRPRGLRPGRRAVHGRGGRPAPATGRAARRLRRGRRRVRRRRRRAQCRRRPVPAGLPGRGPGGGRAGSAPSSWTRRCIRRGSRTRHAPCTGQIRRKSSLSGNCRRSR